MVEIKKWWWSITQGSKESADEERREELYREIHKAHMEWEKAYLVFEHAQGEDEVDFAIYTLEAAERKYQIYLKEAKQANLKWGAFQYGRLGSKNVTGEE